jgi:hypothetical protein
MQLRAGFIFSASFTTDAGLDNVVAKKYPFSFNARFFNATYKTRQQNVCVSAAPGASTDAKNLQFHFHTGLLSVEGIS